MWKSVASMKPLRGIYEATKVKISRWVLPDSLQRATGRINSQTVVSRETQQAGNVIPTKKRGHNYLFSPYLPRTCCVYVVHNCYYFLHAKLFIFMVGKCLGVWSIARMRSHLRFRLSSPVVHCPWLLGAIILNADRHLTCPHFMAGLFRNHLVHSLMTSPSSLSIWWKTAALFVLQTTPTAFTVSS